MLCLLQTENNHSPHYWDIWWSEIFGRHQVSYRIWHWFLWRAYARLLRHVDLGTKSRVLELGCGSGRISLLIAQGYGCHVTLVDQCASAIDEATRSFRSYNISAEFVQSDIFAFRREEEFDLVHSQGLIEHFQPRETQEALLVHRNAARERGYVITFAPCTSLVYKFTSWLMKATNNWYFGYEVPLGLSDHTELHREAGLTVIAHTSALSRELGLLSQRVQIRTNLH